MERLTKISEIGNAYYPKCFEEPCCGMGECLDDRCSLMLDACKKLAEYEQSEEQGLLVRLPANKNKEIYIISSRWTVCSECGSRFDEYNCIGCEYECDSKKEYYVYPTYLSSIDVNTYANRFGKTIFLTREEAEKKLEEMKKNEP
jgi:hypothetical protein